MKLRIVLYMSDKKLNLKATPEIEDFRGKYESGKAGDFLLNGYFNAVRKLLAEANLKKNSKTIEIGCGEGLSTRRLAEMLPQGITLDASEYVKRQIALAKKNNPGIKITQESAYELNHKDNTYDLVFLLEVLEHLDYPSKALQEIKRVLKPNGYLIIGVPREPIWRSLNMARGKYWSDLGNTPGHLNNWSTKSLVHLVETQFGKVISKKKPLPWTLLLVKNQDV